MPCAVVLQINSLSGFSFVTFHNVIEVVFLSFGWSSSSRLSLCRDGESWIPIGRFSGPSVWILGGISESLSPCQFLLPDLCCCMSTFFISFFRAFFSSIHSSLLNRLLGLLCCAVSIIIKSNAAVLVVLIMCAVFFSSILAYFVVTSVFFQVL